MLDFKICELIIFYRENQYNVKLASYMTIFHLTNSLQPFILKISEKTTTLLGKMLFCHFKTQFGTIFILKDTNKTHCMLMPKGSPLRRVSEDKSMSSMAEIV